MRNRRALLPLTRLCGHYQGSIEMQARKRLKAEGCFVRCCGEPRPSLVSLSVMPCPRSQRSLRLTALFALYSNSAGSSAAASQACVRSARAPITAREKLLDALRMSEPWAGQQVQHTRHAPSPSCPQHAALQMVNVLHVHNTRRLHRAAQEQGSTMEAAAGAVSARQLALQILKLMQI